MWIKKLKLNYFRNAVKKEFDFNNKKNIIIGNNGSGKTSLLEAIYLFSFGKSFRTQKESSLININSPESYIEGEFFLESPLNISIGISNKKTIKINNNSIKRLSELIGTINTIIFTEKDIDLLERSPDYRRRFVDIIFSQMNKDYLLNLMKYHKTVEERNAYLKTDSNDKNLIDAYNKSLVESGSELINSRILYLRNFFLLLEKEIKKFDIPFLKNIIIEYNTNVLNRDIINDENINKKKIKKEFNKKLKENFKKEKELKFTINGPHRDDIYFYKEKGYKFSDYSSTGERRLLAILIKMTEAQFLYENKNDLPIILLDDILLELDKENGDILMKYINSSNNQFFITTTNDRVYKKIIDKSLIQL